MIKIISLVFLAQILQAATIINEGKFFYTSMRSGAKNITQEDFKKNPLGIHFIDVLISDAAQPFSLGLNTQFSTISVVSTNC